uniref:Zinc finger protein 385C n=1 Tax=Petromyzon marinus TaxID=7757 RepID=S4R7B7_PETMA
MDPVQKAVLNHTFGVPAPPRRRQLITCNICQLRFNSQNQAEAHYKGSKHLKKMKTAEAEKVKQGSPPAVPSAQGPPALSHSASPAGPLLGWLSLILPPTPTPRCADLSSQSSSLSQLTAAVAVTESNDTSPASDAAFLPQPPGPTVPAITADGPPSSEEGGKGQLFCSICKLAVNSQSQLVAHNNGARHKAMMEGKEVKASGRPFPRHSSRHKAARARTKLGPAPPPKAFHCQLCDIKVNSETQLQQHMASRKHKDKEAGRPPKPKFSPYNKLQRRQGTHLVVILKAKMALHKDLSKPLMAAMAAAGFLPSPLTATAVGMASPMALRSAAGTAASLLAGPGLSQAILRPAPGPIRTSHPCTRHIVFAPY